MVGEDTSKQYDKNKYRLNSIALHSNQHNRASLISEDKPRLYGAPRPDSPEQQPAAQEPSSLGCWIVPQKVQEFSGGSRQLVTDAVVPRVPQQIVATQACIGASNTVADYSQDMFMSPFDQAQPVIATGSLINTWTGEVSSTYEDAFPPVDRNPGDIKRANKSAHLRLLAAEGNAPTQRRKREQEDPLPAADSGRHLEGSSHAMQENVRHENNERNCRDQYFNRNELAPTPMEQTKNPFGFCGFVNKLRIQPKLEVTQELDNKSWTPNATDLPSNTANPRAAQRLRADGDVRPGHIGPVGNYVTPEPKHLIAEVKRSLTNRNLEGESMDFSASVPLYGSSVPQEMSNTTRRDAGLEHTEDMKRSQPPIDTHAALGAVEFHGKESMREARLGHRDALQQFEPRTESAAAMCASETSVRNTLRGSIMASTIGVSTGQYNLGAHVNGVQKRSIRHELDASKLPQAQAHNAHAVFSAKSQINSRSEVANIPTRPPDMANEAVAPIGCTSTTLSADNQTNSSRLAPTVLPEACHAFAGEVVSRLQIAHVGESHQKANHFVIGAGTMTTEQSRYGMDNTNVLDTRADLFETGAGLIAASEQSRYGTDNTNVLDTRADLFETGAGLMAASEQSRESEVNCMNILEKRANMFADGAGAATMSTQSRRQGNADTTNVVNESLRQARAQAPNQASASFVSSRKTKRPEWIVSNATGRPQSSLPEHSASLVSAQRSKANDMLPACEHLYGAHLPALSGQTAPGESRVSTKNSVAWERTHVLGSTTDIEGSLPPAEHKSSLNHELQATELRPSLHINDMAMRCSTENVTLSVQNYDAHAEGRNITSGNPGATTHAAFDMVTPRTDQLPPTQSRSVAPSFASTLVQAGEFRRSEDIPLHQPHGMSESVTSFAVPGSVFLPTYTNIADDRLTMQGGAIEIARRRDVEEHWCRDTRGAQNTYRRSYEKIGGDVERDPMHLFEPGTREWRAEVIITPVLDRRDAFVQSDRPTIGRMRTPVRRDPRIARSPKPGFQIRSGAPRLMDEVSSRCEEVT